MRAEARVFRNGERSNLPVIGTDYNAIIPVKIIPKRSKKLILFRLGFHKTIKAEASDFFIRKASSVVLRIIEPFFSFQVPMKPVKQASTQLKTMDN